MDNDIWKPRQRIEKEYQSAIKKLMRKISLSIADITDPLDLEAKIRAIVKSKLFTNYAMAAASRMITGLFTDTGKNWREASKAGMNGKMVHELLRKELQGPLEQRMQAIVRQNAQLITSLPLDVSEKISEHVRNEIVRGSRSDEILKQLPDYFQDIGDARAKLIARTETSKAHTALVRVRAENLGLKWYIWRTSKDTRVRSSHEHMDRVLVCWDDPPSPEALIGEKPVGVYHAGEIFNCRCFAQPLYDLDLISWPCKVYRNGDITTMTRAQFEKVA